MRPVGRHTGVSVFFTEHSLPSSNHYLTVSAFFLLCPWSDASARHSLMDSPNAGRGSISAFVVVGRVTQNFYCN